MRVNLFQSPQYKTVMQEHIYNILQLLLEETGEFAVACELKYITFDPELPDHISAAFNDTVLFIISNYTLESARLDKKTFRFEAGFGEENFGSIVSMPLLAIKQIFVGDTPLVLNYASPTLPHDTAPKHSMEALLSNPENRKLLKKKKKP